MFTVKEINRLKILQDVIEHNLRPGQAADIIDGSPHDCFEGRAPKCCLLVFVDDATGRIMHLRFD